jgi:hypothetical protein
VSVAALWRGRVEVSAGLGWGELQAKRTVRPKVRTKARVLSGQGINLAERRGEVASKVFQQRHQKLDPHRDSRARVSVFAFASRLGFCQPQGHAAGIPRETAGEPASPATGSRPALAGRA